MGKLQYVQQLLAPKLSSCHRQTARWSSCYTVIDIQLLQGVKLSGHTARCQAAILAQMYAYRDCWLSSCHRHTARFQAAICTVTAIQLLLAINLFILACSHRKFPQHVQQLKAVMLSQSSCSLFDSCCKLPAFINRFE